MNYNPKDRDSIYNYALDLHGKSFNEIIREYEVKLAGELMQNETIYEITDKVKNNKGKLGEIIEEFYFGLNINNESRPDFAEADMELKVTPYKINKNGTISAKERLIISMINYFDIVEKDFFESNVWHKIQFILLIFYLHDNNKKDRKDFIIDYIYKYSPLKNDLEIIIEDYKKIKQKVVKGLAHELSEGDTLYLGAATKSSSSKVTREQPNSSIDAKPRAFSFKSSYMTYLLREIIHPHKQKMDSILKNASIKTSFEDYVKNKLSEYIGKSEKELSELFNITKSKNRYSRIVLKILGVNTNNAEEFEKANIVVKTIRVQKNNNVKESISFPTFNILELLNETWEESGLRNTLAETKFLFIIFKETDKGYILSNSKFWNIDENILDKVVKKEWKLIKEKFNDIQLVQKSRSNGVRFENNLPKKSETEIIHVRPHASKSAYLIDGIKYGNGNLERDTDLLPNGDRMVKQCFWINNNYIVDNIINDLT